MPYFSPSRPPPVVLPSHAHPVDSPTNPNSLEAASLALCPYRSASASSSANSAASLSPRLGGAASPPPQLRLPGGGGPVGSLVRAERERVREMGRVERARRGLVAEAEGAREGVQGCRREVARVRGEVEAVFDQLTAGTAPLSPEQDALLEARALELDIPAEAGLVFEFMQLKEIDKEAAQIEALRPSATATAAAERAHGALLPARARVETYRRALVGQLARAEETYAREARELTSELEQLRARLKGDDDEDRPALRHPAGSLTPTAGEVHMIESVEDQSDIVVSPVGDS